MKKSIFLFGILFLMMACNLPAKRSVSTPIASSSKTEIPKATATQTLEPTPAFTPSPTSSQEPTLADTLVPVGECNPDDVIQKLNKIVPYKEFVLTYNIYQGDNYLVFWIVDPNLHPKARPDELEIYFSYALTDAIELAHKFNQADACVSKLFTVFNPVVVDANYNGWFSGLFDIKLFPSVETLEEDNYREIASSTRQVWKRTTVPDIKEIPSTSCTWSEASANIARHFYISPLNTSILVADNIGVTVTVNFASRNIENIEAEELVTFLNTGIEIGCLQPPVKFIVVILMDTDGNVLHVNRFPINNDNDIEKGQDG